MIVTPGPIPTDGTPIPDPEATLTTFVEQSVLSDFGDDSFDDGIGLWYSATEPPPQPRLGQLWFKRGEGRLYMYHTAIVNIPEFDLGVVGSSITAVSHFIVSGGDVGQWQCLSDRRQVYALYYEEEMVNVPEPIGPHVNTDPGGPCALGMGGFEAAQIGWNTSTILTALDRASTLIDPPPRQWTGLRLRSFDAQDAGNNSKYFFSTDNTTYSGHYLIGRVFHDVGFARFKQQGDEDFPEASNASTDSAIFVESLAPDGADFPLAFALQSAYYGRFNV